MKIQICAVLSHDCFCREFTYFFGIQFSKASKCVGVHKRKNMRYVHELYLLGVKIGRDLKVQIQSDENLDFCDAFLSRTRTSQDMWFGSWQGLNWLGADWLIENQSYNHQRLHEEAHTVNFFTASCWGNFMSAMWFGRGQALDWLVEDAGSQPPIPSSQTSCAADHPRPKCLPMPKLCTPRPPPKNCRLSRKLNLFQKIINCVNKFSMFSSSREGCCILMKRHQ